MTAHKINLTKNNEITKATKNNEIIIWKPLKTKNKTFSFKKKKVRRARTYKT